jgi:hypothetical protein
MSDSCRHLAQTSSGSNQFCKQVKCCKCDKVLLKYFHNECCRVKVTEHLRNMYVPMDEYAKLVCINAELRQIVQLHVLENKELLTRQGVYDEVLEKLKPDDCDNGFSGKQDCELEFPDEESTTSAERRKCAIM